jgi:hypothetical protein
MVIVCWAFAPITGFGMMPLIEGAGAEDANVWKKRSAAELEHPTELQALRFHRYCFPALKVVVYEVPDTT